MDLVEQGRFELPTSASETGQMGYPPRLFHIAQPELRRGLRPSRRSLFYGPSLLTRKRTYTIRLGRMERSAGFEPATFRRAAAVLPKAPASHIAATVGGEKS